MNNPYAAYQKFTKAPPVKPKNDVTNHNTPVSNNSVPKTAKDNNAYKPNQYLQTTIMTATPEELTLMLYDGAIKFMNQAIIFIQMKQIEKSHKAIIRAQDIFTELMTTLDMDYEISVGLYNIYDYIYHSLLKANAKKDTEILREMISNTRELRETWSQAMKTSKKEQHIKNKS